MRTWLHLALIGIFCASTLNTTGTPPSRWHEPLRGLPLITSFDVPPSRHNGEVWTFASADAGKIWVGSDELFLFDGISREKVDLPFETYAVRALAYDRDGKLWIGAIGEIGYLERTSSGRWSYVSAREKLLTASRRDVRIWEALSTPKGVVFVSEEEVLRWDGIRFESWPIRSDSRLRASRDRDAIWIVAPGEGVFRMDEDGPRKVIGATDLPDATASWVLGSTTGDGSAHSEPLIMGGFGGIYRRNNNGWIRLEHLSMATRGRSAWRAVLLDDQTIALGTVLGGVVIGTINDDVLAVVDRSSGLPHDAVTGLWLDERSGHLWIGYVGGMSRIESTGAVSVFDTRNGLGDAPTIKTLAHGANTYILSRRALSILASGSDGRPGTVRQLSELPMPFSDAVSKGENLWLSGLGGGLWRVQGSHVQQETPVVDFIYGITDPRAPPNELFFMEDSKLRTLIPRTGGGWMTRNLGVDLGAFWISAAWDRGGDLWISTVTRGVFRFRIHGDPATPRLELIRQFNAGSGLPANEVKRPVLTTVGGRVFLLSESLILGYDSVRDQFSPIPGLEAFAGLAGTLSDDPDVAYWVIQNTTIASSAPGATALVRMVSINSDALPSWWALDTAGLENAGRISTLSFTGGDHPALWIGGSRALLRKSVSSLTAPPDLPPVQLRAIVRNGEALSLPSDKNPIQLDSGTTRLRIELDGVVRADGRGPLVQASLRGVSNDWSPPQMESAFEFTGLRAGSYTLLARTIDCFGQTGPEISLPFVLAPPWHQSRAAFVIYVLAATLAIGAGVRWRLRHLRRLAERLNRLVDERTAELARANAARNDFLESISHEIRNPLNGITNLVDLLHDEKLSPEAKKLAEFLGRSAAQLKDVFSDVLGYTKLEYNHVEVESVVFSLRQLLDETLALFAVQTRENHMALRLAFPADLHDGFRGDAAKLSTIVNNYVSNALKYASSGTIDIEVRATLSTSDPHTSVVWIGVRDHGPGISLDEQSRLFKKFIRGQTAKARGISGTGLGLAICRGIAELLDGRVGVVSEPGKGATFWLEVPLFRAPLPTTPNPSHQAERSQPGPEIGRALIVDDQEYNQAVLRGIAQRLGYRGEVAYCADEVWPLVDLICFDVVFLDWELPGFSGSDIALRLRTHPNTRNAVIIATTAHDTQEIVQKCIEAGMDGFAAKPFDTSQVREIVREAASRRSESKAPACVITRHSQRTDKTETPNQLTLTAFSDFAAGDPERASQAITLYLETLDQEVAELRTAVSAMNRQAVASRAHRLRSHAGLVNGMALNAAAQLLFLAARSDSDTALLDCTKAVFDEAALLRTAVTDLVSGTSSNVAAPEDSRDSPQLSG